MILLAASIAVLFTARSSGEILPKDFLLGVASSSYQVEGAPYEDGKGESIIDRYVKTHPNWTVDGSNGDVACDSYHRYPEDVELVKELGADFYLFSISWPRILPNGDPTKINKPGIDYYNKIIDLLLSKNIQPVVTMFHWDLPQTLQDIGGWANSAIVDYFTEFARILFKNYGDRVKWWVTLNEPQLFSVFGHAEGENGRAVYPPGIFFPGVAEYLCVHNFLLAHATVYRMYAESFPQQKGKIGIGANVFSYTPATPKPEDLAAAQRYMMFEGGWILHPLIKGDYPQVMRERVDLNSKLEGRSTSRLPVFSPQQIQLLKGTLDFVGLNYYTSFKVISNEAGPKPSYQLDSGALFFIDPNATLHGVSWLTDTPEGFHHVLKWLRDEFDNPPVFITQNGCDDPLGINDTSRIGYHKGHLKAMKQAMNEGSNVIGYTVWSLMDSFEWSTGYVPKFGIYHVDFTDPERKRSPKNSVEYFKSLFKKKTLED